MKKLILLSAISITILISCNQQKSTEQSESSESETPIEDVSGTPTLTKAWESDTTLLTAESVLFDKTNDILFVACINGRPLDKDGNGFIAQVGLDGKIINEKWATDLDAPKGMGIYDNKLYVTNITQLVEIEIATGQVSNRWDVEGSGFLNDITIDKSGVIYFTDSQTNKIHALENGEVSTWLQDSTIAGYNGLLAEEGGLMLASMGTSNFAQINWETKAIVVKTDSIGAGDGIAADGNGNYIVSSWAGEVFHIDGSTWEKTSILSTQADGIQSADITYIPEKNLLLVPTFFSNSVVAYRLE